MFIRQSLVLPPAEHVRPQFTSRRRYDYDRAGWSELQPKEQGAAAGSADDR